MQQSNTLLPHTLVARGLWISVIEHQSIRSYTECSTYTADATSTITRHHIAEHRRQERPRGALHARRNRATPHHRWVERSTPVADPRPVMFPTYCVIRTSCGLQAQGRDSWVVMQGYIARHSEGKGKESE